MVQTGTNFYKPWLLQTISFRIYKNKNSKSIVPLDRHQKIVSIARNPLRMELRPRRTPKTKNRGCASALVLLKDIQLNCYKIRLHTDTTRNLKENMREIEALTNDIDIKIKEAIDREILFG